MLNAAASPNVGYMDVIADHTCPMETVDSLSVFSRVKLIFSPFGFRLLFAGFRSLIVRRQGFWDQWALKLRESLAHFVGLIMQRAGGDASVALRVSFV